MKLANKIRSMATAFARDESGQSTTEYVLLLLFVVIAVNAVGKGLKDKLNTLIGNVFKKTDEAVNEAGP